MATHVRDVMTTRPRGVTRETRLSEVAEVMEAEDVGAIPILDGEQLVGMITDRDIVVRAIARGLDPNETRVSAIASRDMFSIQPEQDLDDALHLMARHQVRRLPVVDQDDRLVGIVSQADVALHEKDKTTGGLVEVISRPHEGPRVTE